MEVNIQIDGKSLRVEQGTNVLEAALTHGIYIPHLCHHPDLPELDSCRLCIVEVDGREGVTPSCKLLREERILLAGDAISPEMCLFFPESMGVEVYLDTLQRIMAMNLEGFVQGHFTRLFPARVLPKREECAHLPEQGKGLAYTNSLVRMGKGRVHVLSVRDPDVGGIICMITKEPGYDPEGLNALA